MSAKSASPRHSPTFRGVACASFFEVPGFWSSWKLSMTGQHFLHEIPRLWLVSRTHGLGGIRYQAATWRRRNRCDFCDGTTFFKMLKCYHCQLSAAWWIFSSFSFFKKMLKGCHIQAFSPSKGHNFVLKKHAGPLP